MLSFPRFPDKSMRTLLTTGLLLSALLLAGCRGMQSDKPPVHPNLNMDFQEKFEAQEANPFFADNAAMRKPVPGTVARGLLKEDVALYEGRTEDGAYVDRIPMEINRALVERGQERYNIYCAVCHGQSGDGQGVIMRGDYGYTPATSYHGDRLRTIEDGYMYDVITNGIRNMPGYAQQIPVRDRWAIVAYIRALQLNQNAGEGDVPESIIARVQEQGDANIEGGRTPSN